MRDPDGDRDSGFDDTIVPVDYQQQGQLDSDTLHRHLVSKLPPSSSLFVVFDCCHSGSAIELPFVYRTDADGNVNMMDNVKQGLHLMGTASHLLQGGFTYDKVNDAKQLFAGAQSFFKSFQNQGRQQGEGLGEEKFQEDWVNERKSVFMFSGCRDDQTSADATIGGSHVGAMSWALLETLYSHPQLTYVQVRSVRRLRVWSGANASHDAGPTEHAPIAIRQIPAGATTFGGHAGGFESAFEPMRGDGECKVSRENVAMGVRAGRKYSGHRIRMREAGKSRLRYNSTS